MVATITITIIIYTLMMAFCFAMFDDTFKKTCGEKISRKQLLRKWVGLTLFSPIIITIVLAIFVVAFILCIPIALMVIILFGLIKLFDLDISWIG